MVVERTQSPMIRGRMPDWTHAGGEHQLPFMAAASKALRGELGACPRCSQGPLRRYFHKFDGDRPQGTLWVWCGSCRTYAHVPRVEPREVPVDPFAHLSLHAFADLERSPAEPFLDRLERLWNEGALAG